MNKVAINKVFDVSGGNSGLTEEIIYLNKPKTKDSTITVYSGATMGQTLMGKIDESTIIDGKKIKVYSAPALVVVRKGLAGKTQLINEGRFTINDDAYVVNIKSNYRDKVKLEWFAIVSERYTHACVTSKGSNGTFSKEQFLKGELEYPNLTEQNDIINASLKIAKLKKALIIIDKQIKEILEKQIVESVDTTNYVIGQIFDIYGGNSGLTEELIYNNKPINNNDKLKVYSSSTILETNMGTVSKNLNIKGNTIKKFLAPAIIITRNGQAGKIDYIKKGEFTVNDHAYVLKVKPKYTKLINLEWLAIICEQYTSKCVTSKDSNGTFNKELFMKLIISIPNRSYQNELASIYNNINTNYYKINIIKALVYDNDESYKYWRDLLNDIK